MSKECPAVEGNRFSKGKPNSDGDFKQESENTRSDTPDANKFARRKSPEETDPSLSNDSTPSVGISNKNLVGTVDASVLSFNILFQFTL